MSRPNSPPGPAAPGSPGSPSRWVAGSLALLLAGALLGGRIEAQDAPQDPPAQPGPKAKPQAEPKPLSERAGYPAPTPDQVPPARRPQNSPYVGSATCGECHHDDHAGWLQTAHPYQERVASQDTVLGDFHGKTLDLKGVPVRPFVEDGRYLIETPDAAGKLTVYPIARVIGGTMYKQRYVTTLPNGHDAVLPIEWNLPKQEWRPFHAPSGYKPGQARFWANPSRSWAIRCAGCHVVGLELDQPDEEGWAATRYVELGVGCESCHGPGRAHAEDPEQPIKNPAKFAPEETFSLCASCHARGFGIGPKAEAFQPYKLGFPLDYEVGDGNVQRSFEFSRPLTNFSTWAFLGNRRSRQHHQQANDFERSAHYQQAGFACTTCHESHGKQRYALVRQDPHDNSLCLDCHEDRAEPARLEAHTHHPAGSEGSKCVNCHMPKVVTHANPRELRSHTFWAPNPAIDAKRRVPEACTLCHTDKPREWAAQAVDQWKFGEADRPKQEQPR